MAEREMAGIEELRAAVAMFDACDEHFNWQFTAAQLLKLWRMSQRSNGNILPDDWTARQIKEALRGTPPRWDLTERPVYRSRKR